MTMMMDGWIEMICDPWWFLHQSYVRSLPGRSNGMYRIPHRIVNSVLRLWDCVRHESRVTYRMNVVTYGR
jgi:hypothetical protein